MTTQEFWYGDLRMLSVRQKAYMRDVSFKSWQNGNYMFEAVSKAIHNGFGRKKGERPIQYTEWKDPFYQKEKVVITEENLEEEFRKQQAAQNDWLFGRRDT
jgi:hypothetical protein